MVLNWSLILVAFIKGSSLGGDNFGIHVIGIK